MGIFSDLDEAIRNLLPILTKLLLQLWNRGMRVLVALSIMPTVRKYPWLLLVVILLAMALFLPIGILFLLCGLAALDKAKAENNFIVNLDPVNEDTKSGSDR